MKASNEFELPNSAESNRFRQACINQNEFFDFRSGKRERPLVKSNQWLTTWKRADLRCVKTM